jgi:hypothetical protein
MGVAERAGARSNPMSRKIKPQSWVAPGRHDFQSHSLAATIFIHTALPNSKPLLEIAKAGVKRAIL